MREKEKFNLSYTYMIPLVMVNVTVAKKGIINSFIYHPDYNYNTEDMEGLFVKLSYEYISKSDVKYNVYVKEIINIDDESFMIFIIPPRQELLLDMLFLLKGHYSYISIIGKTIIKEFWNLSEKSRPLLALFKSEKLRELIEKELDVVIDENAELGNIIDKSKETYITKKQIQI